LVDANVKPTTRDCVGVLASLNARPVFQILRKKSFG
jgi:hypothetical protein